MNIFLSWSGLRSKAVAEALRDWIPNVIQAAEPWVSSQDIQKGRLWDDSLSKKLDEVSFGIICTTAKNQHEPWLMFEAGAIAKQYQKAHTIPYLIDLRPAELKPPLSNFQAVEANEEGTKDILKLINQNAKAKPLSDERFETTWKKWWPELKEALGKLPKEEGKPLPPNQGDMIEQVLLEIRKLSRPADAPLPSAAVPAMWPPVTDLARAIAAGAEVCQYCGNAGLAEGVNMAAGGKVIRYCPRCNRIAPPPRT